VSDIDQLEWEIEKARTRLKRTTKREAELVLELKAAYAMIRSYRESAARCSAAMATLLDALEELRRINPERPRSIRSLLEERD
jgi:hypothetical protein